LTGDTCAPGLLNNVASYTSLTCRINGNYSKPEAIYKVWLHDGNEVKFNLAVRSGDLALALISTCGVGSSCVSSSDNINPSPPPPSPPPASEELRSQNYNPGFYFLYIDARGSGAGCGRYELDVSGVNPVPDLELKLIAQKSVMVGKKLDYTLSVKNIGALNATEVNVTQTLPGKVSTVLTLPAGCKVAGTPKTVTCDPFPLDKGDTVTKKISVTAPSTPGPLISTAKTKAKEGDQNTENNSCEKDVPGRCEITTTVKAQIDLSIKSTTSPAVFTPGRTLSYILKVHNAGPSEATGVVVTDTLPEGVSFVSATDCQNASGTVTCNIPKIAAGTTVKRLIKVTLQAPAAETRSLVNKASVTAAEPDSGTGHNSATSRTRVIHKRPIANPPRPQPPPG